MKQNLTIILLLFVNTIAIGQSTVQFDIEEIYVTDTSVFKFTTDFDKLDTAFFQDENYYVRRTCFGEFGGSIWFRNKKTGIEYSCAATCPVVVNKIDNKYIVTTSLTHFIGHSSVIEIENPDSMSIFQRPEPERVVGRWGCKKRRWYKWGFRKVYYTGYAGDDESKTRKGTNLLVDTIGATILFSFPYKEQLYHIVSDAKTLYLSQIENNILTTIDTIFVGLDSFNKSEDGILYSYNTSGFETKNHNFVLMFKNSGLVGFLEINDNKIKLTRCQ